jgi:hypothetical protein
MRDALILADGTGEYNSFLCIMCCAFESGETGSNGFACEKTSFCVHPLKNHFETLAFGA